MSLAGEIEVDESYFSSRRKDMFVLGAAGKVSVFGLLKKRQEKESGVSRYTFCKIQW